jgi:OmpA-OmpF porin, OOP family
MHDAARNTLDLRLSDPRSFVSGSGCGESCRCQEVVALTVFFDHGKSQLSPQAVATVRQASSIFASSGARIIILTGHTDASQSDVDAVELGYARANAVKEVLMQQGLSENQIIVFSKGKQALLVRTPDGVREPQNRRVEVVVQR